MIAYGHFSGGADILKRYKLGATVSNAGIVTIDGAAGVIPCTTTDGADSAGLAVDTGTYSTVQGAGNEGLVTLSVRPDLIIKALISGSGTAGTAMVTISNTLASATGVLVTDAVNITATDVDGGLVWCVTGANVGQSRTITTHTGSTSYTVTVPFDYAIAVGDTFLFCPWNESGSGAAGDEGAANVTTTATFIQADGSTATAAGLQTSVYEVIKNSSTDSWVAFRLRLHIHGSDTLAS